MNVLTRSCGISLLAIATSSAANAAAKDMRLIAAVKDGDTGSVRRLLALNLDVNTRQPDGASALHWAAERDRVDLADALLKAGARATVENDYGVTPLTLAATNGRAA